MTELSVEGAALDRLAQHFVDRGANHFEPYLNLLGAQYSKPRFRQSPIPEYDLRWDGLSEEDAFFDALTPRDGTYAVAGEKDFGGSDAEPGAISIDIPAPWAAKFASDWNTAVAGRATDMTRVIDELYKLADILIAIVEDYENQDLYNADGIRRSYEKDGD